MMAVEIENAIWRMHRARSAGSSLCKPSAMTAEASNDGSWVCAAIVIAATPLARS